LLHLFYFFSLIKIFYFLKKRIFMLNRKLSIYLLLACFQIKSEQYLSRNTVYYRPYVSALTELLGTQNEVVLNKDKVDKDKDNYRIYFDAITDYRQNFCSSGCKDFNSLSFWSGSNTLTIGTNNGEADIDGYNLGLGYNFETDANGVAGKLTLNNNVRQVATNFKLYYEHNKHASGFYMKLDVPLVALTVNSDLTEEPAVNTNTSSAFLTQTTSTGSVINYANSNYLTPQNYYVSASQYFMGGTDSCSSMNGVHDKPIRLRSGGFIHPHTTYVRVADLTAAVGYNLITESDNRFLIGFKFSAPTGNLPSAFSMYEPILGRAGMWAVGGEIYGHYKVWEGKNNDKALYLNMQGEAFHLMANRRPSFRSFDLLANGKGSKYLLVQRYNSEYLNIANAYASAYVPKELTPAINITTLPIRSKISVEGSFAGQIKYVHDDTWAIALSGEIFGRSEEKLSIDSYSVIDFKYPNLNDYAVVGRQVGQYLINNSTNTESQNLYANLCEPLATINKSQNPIQLTGNVIPPSTSVTVPTTLPEGIADATDSKNRIPAEFDKALDICGAQVPSVLSGSIMLSVEKIWKDTHLVPAVSIFGGAQLNNNNSLPQMWVVGINGNFQF
jgi:hypothetical protein